MNIEKIGEELSTVLKTKDLTEIAFSSIEEASKTISIISLLLKTGHNIQDALFCKKLMSFIHELKDIPITERERMINKIDDSEKYRVRVGEKLLYIVDSSDDHEKSCLIGTVFKSVIKKEISYDDFTDVATVINKISINDFNWFIEHGCRRKTEKSGSNPSIIEELCGTKYGNEFNLEEIRGLIGSGLFEMSYQPLEVEVTETDDHKTLIEGGSKYSTSTYGGVSVYISSAGEVILKLFSENYVLPDIYAKQVSKNRMAGLT